MFEHLSKTDQQIMQVIKDETRRQNNNLELIASENFVSLAVLEAMGSQLTNKYAEGYPGRRYYGGCEFVDVAENLARDRAKELFGADHANVQPNSGSQANQAVFFAALQPGDTILGMDLTHGGHLTHGSPVNQSGKWFNVVHYGVRKEDERIDYDMVRDMALKHRPKLIIAGASAYPRIIDFAKFREIADEVNALFMVDMAHIAGLVAAGLHPSPVPYADFVTTTTHKTLRGPRGGMILTAKEHAKDIDKAIFPGIQGGPLMHIIAAKAVAFREALQPEFKEYQKHVVDNAQALPETLQGHGFPLVSGGTDNHLLLVNVKAKGWTGKDAEAKLDSVGITVNKNTIPFETESPFVTSGIRIGTPALTTRGMGVEEMRIIGDLIAQTLEHDRTDYSSIREQVAELAKKHPLYPEIG